MDKLSLIHKSPTISKINTHLCTFIPDPDDGKQRSRLNHMHCHVPHTLATQPNAVLREIHGARLKIYTTAYDIVGAVGRIWSGGIVVLFVHNVAVVTVVAPRSVSPARHTIFSLLEGLWGAEAYGNDAGKINGQLVRKRGDDMFGGF